MKADWNIIQLFLKSSSKLIIVIISNPSFSSYTYDLIGWFYIYNDYHGIKWYEG